MGYRAEDRVGRPRSTPCTTTIGFASSACSSWSRGSPTPRRRPSCGRATPTARGVGRGGRQEPARRSRGRGRRRELPRRHRPQGARGRAARSGVPRRPDRPREPGPAPRSAGALAARARRTTQRIAILFLDLDDFKTDQRQPGPWRGRPAPRGDRRRLHGALRAATRSPGWAATSSQSSSRTPMDRHAVEVAERLLETARRRRSNAAGESCSSTPASASPSPAAGGPRGGAAAQRRCRDVHREEPRQEPRSIIFEPEMHRAALARLALRAISSGRSSARSSCSTTSRSWISPPGASSASRPCCAGAIRPGVSCCRLNSCPSPRRPG